MKILILCTGNSCRSQMAEGFLKSFDPFLQVFSAGTRPEKQVNPKALAVMEEIGINISSHYPKLVDQFINEEFDYVITVCDKANENCPVFTGNVHHRLHRGFEDPASATGSTEEVFQFYRKVRDQMKASFWEFYATLK